MKKRLISTALALCMVLAMMPAAFAASSAPTGLEWVEEPGEIQKEFTDGENYPEEIYPGYVTFDRIADGSNVYKIEFFKDGEEVAQSTYHYQATDKSAKCAAALFVEEPRESGDYKFTVQMVENDQVEESEVAISEVWHYEAPEAQLAPPNNVQWDGSTARWEAVDGADDYMVVWYFAATEEEEPKIAGSTWGFGEVDNLQLTLEDWVIEEHGEGYYSFKIRALSEDVTKIRPSELSEMSPVYHTDQAAQGIESSLEEILEGLGESPNQDAVAAAVEAVKKLDTDDLRVAMAADQENDGVTAQIQDVGKEDRRYGQIKRRR